MMVIAAGDKGRQVANEVVCKSRDTVIRGEKRL